MHKAASLLTDLINPFSPHGSSPELVLSDLKYTRMEEAFPDFSLQH